MDKKFYFDRQVYGRKNHRFTFPIHKELLNHILSKKSSGDVLDLGCGEGGTALALAKQGFNVTCVDISPKVISLLQKEAKKRKLTLNTKAQDIEAYDIKKPYDVIMLMGVLHFLPIRKAEQLINSCKTMLRSSGLLIIDALKQPKNPKSYSITLRSAKKQFTSWNLLALEEYNDEENNPFTYVVAQKKNII